MSDNLKVMKDEVIKLEECTKNFDNIDIDKLKSDNEYRIKIHTPIIEQLQKINECFLQNYIIKINDLALEIYPLEIEIYYYDNKGIFQDGNSHQNILQQRRFGQIYFHRRGKKENNSIDFIRYGMDICVSKNDCFLSILIRSAYFNEKKEPVRGIRNIVDEILFKYEDKKINEKKKKRNKKENLEKYNKEKEQIRYNLINLEKKEKNIIIETNLNKEKEIKHHIRISNNRYFKHNKKEKKDYDEYELNSFINDNEIVKKIYKDKSSKIREYLEKKLGNKNLFK